MRNPLYVENALLYKSVSFGVVLLPVFRLVFTVFSNNRRPDPPLSRLNWRTLKGLCSSLQFITSSPHGSVRFTDNVLIYTWFLGLYYLCLHFNNCLSFASYLERVWSRASNR